MKSSIAQFGISLLLLALAVLGYGAWYASVAAKSAQAADLQNQIDTQSATAMRVSSARAALAQIASSEAAVNGYFVPESDVVSFIDHLQALGSALSASVNVLSVSAGTTGAHPSLAVSLAVKGSFDAVIRTVGAIEFSPADLSITTLSVEQNAGSWTANLNLIIGSTPGNAPTLPATISAPNGP